MNIIKLFEMLDALHTHKEEILDKENVEFIEKIHKAINGTDTMCLTAVDQHRIRLLHTETFEK